MSTSTTPSNPVRALLGGGSIYTLSLVVQVSSSLLTLPLVTRLLKPSEYGLVALAILITLLLGAVSSFGLQTVLTRMFFAPDGPSKCRQLIVSGTLLSAATVAAAELASPLWIPAFGHIAQPLALHIAVWTAVPSSLTGLSQAYLRAKERAVAFVVLALVSGMGGQILGIALLLIVPTANASIYLGGVAGGWVVAGLIGLGLNRPWRDGLASRHTIREGLRLGVPLVPHNVAWALLALGDRAIIQRIDGSGAVARYQVAYTTGALALTVVTSAASAWMPIVFSAEDDQRRWRVHSETLLAIQLVAALLASGLALVGPPLLRVATPSSYMEPRLASVVAIVALSAFPWTIYAGGMQLLLWRERTRSLGWITPVAAILNIGLVVLLLPPLGLAGAALATLVAFGVLAFLVRRALPDDVPMRNFRVPIVAAWSVAAVLALIGVVVPSTGGWIVLRVLLALCATAGFLLPMRRLLRVESQVVL
jgi:O-antigen/teichoic acid export membrane protein